MDWPTRLQVKTNGANEGRKNGSRFTGSHNKPDIRQKKIPVQHTKMKNNLFEMTGEPQIGFERYFLLFAREFKEVTLDLWTTELEFYFSSSLKIFAW